MPFDVDVAIESFMTTLFEIALRDGVITPEELAIIDAITDIISVVFRKALQNAISDGVITEDQKANNHGICPHCAHRGHPNWITCIKKIWKTNKRKLNCSKK